jgi:hypothetical protein
MINQLDTKQGFAVWLLPIIPASYSIWRLTNRDYGGSAISLLAAAAVVCSYLARTKQRSRAAVVGFGVAGALMVLAMVAKILAAFHRGLG